MKTRILTLILMIALSAGRADGGAFNGKRLLVDTLVDVAGVNSGVTTAPLLLRGQNLLLEFYVDRIAFGSTTGFTIAFNNKDRSFTKNFRIEFFEGLFVSETGARGASLTVGGTFPRRVGRSGYLGAITLSAIRDVPTNVGLNFLNGGVRIFDAEAGTLDTLDAASASVLFRNGIGFEVDLDTHALSGNQDRDVQIVSGGDDVSVEVYGVSVEQMVGYSIRLDFDPDDVTFESFTVGTAGNLRAVAPDSSIGAAPGRAAVEVAAAVLGGTVTTPSGLLGTLTFSTSDSLIGSTQISVTSAQISRSNGIVSASAWSLDSVELRGLVDFNNDQQMTLDDFFVFSAHFGRRVTSSAFDPRFDLDDNGVVGFSDFVILAEAMNKARVTSP